MGFMDNFKVFSGHENGFNDSDLIQKLVTKNYFISPEDNIEDAIKGLRNRSVTGLPVVDDEMTVVGFISEKDCLKFLYNAFYFNQYSGNVSSHMNRDVIVVDINVDLPTILKLFIENPYHVYPVVDEQKKYIGMIRRTDLLAEIYAIMDILTKQSSVA